jgi:predicted hydrocarbon binding protein
MENVMPFRIQRFTNSLNVHANPAVQDHLLQDRPAYDGLTTPVQTAKWIGSLMDGLNEAVGEQIARQVMEDCGRQCIGRSVLDRAQKLQQEASDLDDLLNRLNQDHIGGGKLQRDGDVIHASYARCYCGSVSKTRQPISTTYCHCSCGWYKQLFETLLGKPVVVELVDSIIHGADACRFVIRLNTRS